MIRAVLALGACLALLLGSASVARAAEPVVALYTIGPGSYTFSYWGHTALCVRRPAAEDGTCFDYGVPTTQDAFEMVWASVRGRPLFVAVRVAESRLVESARWEDRTIERQVLPLSPDEARRLSEALERDVDGKEAYAYHPWSANCTTQVRDVIDEAVGGRLRSGADQPVDGVTFRQLSEAGFSGRPLHLAGIAIAVGTPGERRPSAWERMFLPASLRDGVRARLEVAPEAIHTKQAPRIETSTGVGRGLLVLLGAVLSMLAWRGARPGASRAPLVAVGLALGAIALVVDAAVLVVVYPEMWRTWTLAVLWPTDLALGLLPPAAFAKYVRARLVTVCVLLGASVIGVLGQPLWAPALLVLLPFGAAWFFVVRHRGAPAAASALPAVVDQR